MLAGRDLWQHRFQANPTCRRPQPSLSSRIMWRTLGSCLSKNSSKLMLETLDDFYTQDLRVDLVAASQLADLNRKHPEYLTAAARGAFVVSVLQGDLYESVYAPLMERTFDTLAEARVFFDSLASEQPDAKCFDFVAHPTGTAPTQTTSHN